VADDGIDKKIFVVLAKIETTSGTDAVPTVGANAIFCAEAEVQPVIEYREKTRRRNTHAAPGAQVGARHWKWMVKIPFNGPAAPDPTDLLAPVADPLIRCCRHKVTPDSSPVSEHVYTPDSQSAPSSITLYFYRATLDGGDWELIKVTGARGTMKIEGPSADEGFMTFEGLGLYTGAPSSVTKPGAPTYVEPNDSLPDRAHTLTFDSRTDPISSWSFSQNAEVVAKRDQGATYGISCIEVYLNQPTIEIDPEVVLTADYDRYSKASDTVRAALSMQLNTEGGARYALDADEFQFGSFEYSEGEASMRLSQTLYPTDTAAGGGDDSYSLTVTRP
jgi:hypothetical protein